MRTFLRKTAKLLAVIGILVLLVAAFCAGIVWLTLPPAAQDARIPGLLAPVQVGFDADGVPRIHATSATDAAAALGFVHARDRMFQMELMRRAASGRLSELAGPAALPIDRLMRTLGLRQSAVADLAALRRAGDAGCLCPRRECLDRRARPVLRTGVPAAGHAGALAAGRQPALGQDHGPVAVG